jgi:hypothetical protein
MFRRFTIDSLSFFESIVYPSFADQAPSALGFQGTLNEFTVMRNVVSSRPIIDIRRAQNIMQRRDASCDIVYKNLFGASTRKITVTEIYGAVKFCRNEFYQGCLKEFRAKDPLFGNKIVPYFRSAINIDLTTNAYFGDVDRADDPSAEFSTTLFDGIFKWLKLYTTAGIIPAGQTVAIANGTDFTTTPAAAYNIIKALYDKRPEMMKTYTNDQLAFYVSPEIASGYEDYLVATGSGNTQYINDIQNGRSIPAYKGIRILQEPLWTPVISEIKGAAGYAAVLTIRGNFVFATDDSYGEDDGTGNEVAFIVWYDYEHFTWKYVMFMKAGTQIALPEYVVYALSAFV